TDDRSAWFGSTINLLELSETEIVRAGIGRKFQKPTVFEFLTVFENLELAAAGDRSFWRMLIHPSGRPEPERIEEGLGVIGLANVRRAVAGTLSHGQKQWLEIGMLLI